MITKKVDRFLRGFGFTIVELAVVISIIGILATLTAVSYAYLQQDARDKALAADIDSVESELALYATNNDGIYDSALNWDSSLGTNPNIDFVPTSGNTIVITVSGGQYCIKAYNPSSNNPDLSKAIQKESAPGSCGGTGNGGTVATFAGGTVGYVNNTGLAAKFSSYISGIDVDSSGNLYVSDGYNHAIRKISPVGVVTTLAGSGVAGFVDDSGTTAQFNTPRGLAVDSSGNVYVADGNNHAIRKISPAGVVTTLAGSGVRGYQNGTGSGAQFDYPNKIAVDSNGNVYVSDQDLHAIRKITQAGVVTTFVGFPGSAGYVNGTGSEAKFNYIRGLDIDVNDNIYVADSENYRIRKVTPGGVVSTYAGSGIEGVINGPANTAAFSGRLEGISIASDGTMYIAEGYQGYRIRMISANGIVSTLAGSGVAGYVDGTGLSAQFLSPYGVAVNSSNVLYVIDSNGTHSYIRKIE